MEPVLPPGGTIAYEPHALDRMVEFAVSEQDVRTTLERPESIRPALKRPPTDPRNIYTRSIGLRRCKVYVRVGSTPMLVPTVAWHGE